MHRHISLTRARQLLAMTAVLGTVLLCSCTRPLPLQVVVPPDTTVEKGQPVYVDTILAGEVIEVTQEGGEQVANLLVKDQTAKNLLRVGVLYLPASGKIQISTEAVQQGAQPLPRGARIASSSALGILVTKWSTKSTFVAVGLALVAVVVLWLVFRSLVSTAGLILCAALAALLTQAVFFHAIPYVEKALTRLGPPPAASVLAPEQDQVQTNVSPQGALSVPSPGEVIKKAHTSIQELISSRPSPAVVTWSLVFICLFVLLNITLGKATRAWRS